MKTERFSDKESLDFWIGWFEYNCKSFRIYHDKFGFIVEYTKEDT